MRPFDTRVIVETTARDRAGAERGLGRYVAAVTRALDERGVAWSPLSLGPGTGRIREFIDVPCRERRLSKRDFDVFHATNPLASAWTIGPRFVSSILDTAPLDITGYTKTGMKAKIFLKRAAHAKVVLTISRFSAMRVHERLGVPGDRIVVAPLPVEDVFSRHATAADEAVRELHGVGRRAAYFMALADMVTPDPRKRIGWLPLVAAELARRGHRLVVVGAGTDRQSAALGVASGRGRVSDEAFAALLRGASGFVYPSAYEGQGLPPLEAIACGTPVVALNNTAIPEVVGIAGLRVDEPPSSWSRRMASGAEDRRTRAAFVDACCALADDVSLQRRLRQETAAQAARFSRSSFEEALLGAYARVIADSPSAAARA